MRLKSINSFADQVTPRTLHLLIDGYHGEVRQAYFNQMEVMKTICGLKEDSEEKILENGDDSEILRYEPERTIGVDKIINQRERITANKGIKFSLLLAGGPGLGKTTFINTLFGQPLISNQEKRNSSSNQLIERHDFVIEGDNTHLNLTVTETKNFGTKVDNSFAWAPIVNYVDEQMRSYIFQEEQPYRHEMRDNRIDCCVYFLEPTKKNSMKLLDILTMKELCKRVNLIPVMCKCDILSKADLIEFKQNIRKIVDSQNIEVCGFLKGKDKFHHIYDEYPFGIVTSEEMFSRKDKKFFIGRKYGNNYIDIMETEFSKLQDILLNKNLIDFVESTKEYYEDCRSSMLQTRILKTKDLIKSNERTINLDFDNFESNGLNNYYCYEMFNKSKMDEIILEWCPEFISKQLLVKQKFNSLLNLEDKKFQQWKKTLVEKQIKLNKIIELMYKDIDLLKLECQDLEYKVVTGRGIHIIPDHSSTLVGFQYKK